MFHINYQVSHKINLNIEIWHIYFQHQDLGRIMRHKTPRKSVFNDLLLINCLFKHAPGRVLAHSTKNSVYVSRTLPKIPYVGFSPIRLQMQAQSFRILRRLGYCLPLPDRYLSSISAYISFHSKVYFNLRLRLCFSKALYNDY